MHSEQVSLARQVDMALEQLEEELKGMSAGTIVLQIRNDTVGKFGIRHLPIDLEQARAGARGAPGLSGAQVADLRRIAVEAIKSKKGWTHGEISYDFVLRQDKVQVSVQFESNYNMANVLFRLHPKKHDRRGISNFE
ncbi:MULTISPECIES: hypothetical protein [Cohnella]|uniref:hypothetical protein n=1 Tax=Cohnella TaxID=329857 RepID=UPI00037C8282